MPAPCVFQSSVTLDAPIERVFAFHGDPHNISAIAPAWQKARVVRGDAIPRVGDDFEIEVTMLGLLTLRWHGRWQAVESPTLLVDEGLRAGPFVFWQHRHAFRALSASQTEMTDCVTYRIAAGWLGKLAGETIGRLQMRLMFADRHQRTRRYFAESTR